MSLSPVVGGIRYKVWSAKARDGRIEEGAAYYCSVEDFIGEKRVTPEFRAHDFSPPASSSVTELDTEGSSESTTLESLAAKWGAKITEPKKKSP